MQIHQLNPKHKGKEKKRVGRGGKRGTYSGRGMKGQKSRSGVKLKPIIRGLIKRYPKLRGYKFSGYIGGNTTVVNVRDLETKFNAKEKVTPETLIEKGLIRRIKGNVPEAKILGKGNLTKKLIVENCQVSRRAKEKIEKAGGKVK